MGCAWAKTVAMLVVSKDENMDRKKNGLAKSCPFFGVLFNISVIGFVEGLIHMPCYRKEMCHWKEDMTNAVYKIYGHRVC
jgi:hypothetical protein